MRLTDTLKAGIAKEARLAKPNECCGLIVDGKLWPCNNVHSSPQDHFAIDAIDYAKAEANGSVDAIYHSHIDGLRGFSKHDIKACKRSNVPWIVYYAPKAEFFVADPTGQSPYEGRQWIYGIHDCYGLMRDYYRRELGIVLDDFERGDEGEWERDEWRMFADNYVKQGFLEIDGPERKGDVLLMQINAPSPNHVGVITGDGNHFYHHLIDRLSEKSVYGGYWAKVTTVTLRHRLA